MVISFEKHIYFKLLDSLPTCLHKWPASLSPKIHENSRQISIQKQRLAESMHNMAFTAKLACIFIEGHACKKVKPDSTQKGTTQPQTLRMPLKWKAARRPLWTHFQARTLSTLVGSALYNHSVRLWVFSGSRFANDHSGRWETHELEICARAPWQTQTVVPGSIRSSRTSISLHRVFNNLVYLSTLGVSEVSMQSWPYQNKPNLVHVMETAWKPTNQWWSTIQSYMQTGD